MPIEIPALLIEEIRHGRVVLFLGAGASLQAGAPSAQKLTDELSNKYLNGKFKENGLAAVAQYAQSESSQRDVEEYVSTFFNKLEPTKPHLAIPNFPWRGIATTNYDDLVEQAYERSKKKMQSLKPIVMESDQIDEHNRNRDSVILLKLHGCIRAIPHTTLPLILTPDQYVTHKVGRKRLFTTLEEWAYEKTILFIGHSLSDPDLRQILLEISRLSERKPRNYFVVPGLDNIEKRFFESLHFTYIDATFKEFMDSLDVSLPKAKRIFYQLTIHQDHAIDKHFTSTNSQCSANLLSFLEHGAEYVESLSSYESINPESFYKGYSPLWSAIAQNLDVPRHLAETILVDNLLDTPGQSSMRAILIRGAAGSGKSILMQRLAWEAAKTYERFVLYLKPNSNLDTAAIGEILLSTSDHLYLFIDQAADHAKDIVKLKKTLGSHGKRVTLILGERINEWNYVQAELESLVERDYQLKYLSLKEIDLLIDKLTEAKALGRLRGMSHEEIRREFTERAGRQLLVALHEATLGKPFQEIVVDEFNSIPSEEAKDVYASICFLNRFNEPIRAGTISRIHDLTIVEFSERLKSPLEQVVFTRNDKASGDIWFVARHPVVADLVFRNAFSNVEKKFAKYMSCLVGLNPAYTSDRRLLRGMLRGRWLKEAFSERRMIEKIFEVGKTQLGEDGFIYQQIAIFEMQSTDGNLSKAKEALSKAEQLAPSDVSIRHTRAELLLKEGDLSKAPGRRNDLWRQAEALAFDLRLKADDSFPYHTIAKIRIRRLESFLKGDTSSVKDLISAIEDVEEALADGYRVFPDDPYLREAESVYAEHLKDTGHEVSALEAALAKNPRSGYVIKKLSELYAEEGRLADADSVWKKGLESAPNVQSMNFGYAKFLQSYFPSEKSSDIIYHLNRSFTPGDRNREAQILLARSYILTRKPQEAVKVFDDLWHSSAGPGGRNLRIHEVEGVCNCSVSKVEFNYCMVKWTLYPRPIYVPFNDMSDDNIKRLAPGSNLVCRIAFNTRGPVGIIQDIAPN